METEPLLMFRAGRCRYEAETRQVIPEATKGLVEVLQNLILLAGSKEDGITLTWRARDADVASLELAILPGQAAEFKRIPQCGDGREFLVETGAAASPLNFFWMQEPDPTGDEDLFDVLDSLINLSMEIDSDPVSAVVPPVTSHAPQQAAAGPPIDVAELSRAFQQASNVPRYPTVSALLRPEVVGPSIQAGTIHGEDFARLQQLLPPEDQDFASLLDVIRSPHVQGQARTIGSVIDSGHVLQVMANFQMQASNDPSIRFGRDAFISSLLAMEESKREPRQ